VEGSLLNQFRKVANFLQTSRNHISMTATAKPQVQHVLELLIAPHVAALLSLFWYSPF